MTSVFFSQRKRASFGGGVTDEREREREQEKIFFPKLLFFSPITSFFPLFTLKKGIIPSI